MTNKVLTKQQLLNITKKSAVDIEYKDNGEDKIQTRADLYDSEPIESGKLNSKTAYEIRIGKGFYNNMVQGIPIVMKINIVTFDDNDNEIKKEVGKIFQQRTRNETKEQLILKAQEWVSKERERRINHMNKAKKLGTKPSVHMNKFL